MGEASSEVALSDTVAAHSHCYLLEKLVQSTVAARSPGLVIQRRQSQLPRYYAHRLAPNWLRIEIDNVGELKSRFGMFIFAESFNR